MSKVNLTSEQKSDLVRRIFNYEQPLSQDDVRVFVASLTIDKLKEVILEIFNKKTLSRATKADLQAVMEQQAANLRYYAQNVIRRSVDDFYPYVVKKFYGIGTFERPSWWKEFVAVTSGIKPTPSIAEPSAAPSVSEPEVQVKKERVEEQKEEKVAVEKAVKAVKKAKSDGLDVPPILLTCDALTQPLNDVEKALLLTVLKNMEVELSNKIAGKDATFSKEKYAESVRSQDQTYSKDSLKAMYKNIFECLKSTGKKSPELLVIVQRIINPVQESIQEDIIDKVEEAVEEKVEQLVEQIMPRASEQQKEQQIENIKEVVNEAVADAISHSIGLSPIPFSQRSASTQAGIDQEILEELALKGFQVDADMNLLLRSLLSRLDDVQKVAQMKEDELNLKLTTIQSELAAATNQVEKLNKIRTQLEDKFDEQTRALQEEKTTLDTLKQELAIAKEERESKAVIKQLQSEIDSQRSIIDELKRNAEKTSKQLNVVEQDIIQSMTQVQEEVTAKKCYTKRSHTSIDELVQDLTCQDGYTCKIDSKIQDGVCVPSSKDDSTININGQTVPLTGALKDSIGADLIERIKRTNRILESKKPAAIPITSTYKTLADDKMKSKMTLEEKVKQARQMFNVSRQSASKAATIVSDSDAAAACRKILNRTDLFKN